MDKKTTFSFHSGKVFLMKFLFKQNEEENNAWSHINIERNTVVLLLKAKIRKTTMSMNIQNEGKFFDKYMQYSMIIIANSLTLDNEFFMETDTSSDVIDPIEQAVAFSLELQWELPVKFSESLHADSISEQSFTNDDTDEDEGIVYVYHASNSNGKFPEFRADFEENIWSPTYNHMNNFFVRKQRRNYLEGCAAGLSDYSDIGLQALLTSDDESEQTTWYHATSWSSAIKKIEEGPQMSEGPLDMAYNGAFYLNPCYEWCNTKDSQFQGKHAMLIYQFHPETLSKKGKRVLDVNKWKSLAGERSHRSGRFEDDWIYTYQNSDPGHINKSGSNARIRKTRDDKRAIQLIIYNEGMCRKIHKHLIGCVYYENLHAD